MKKLLLVSSILLMLTGCIATLSTDVNAEEVEGSDTVICFVEGISPSADSLSVDCPTINVHIKLHKAHLKPKLPRKHIPERNILCSKCHYKALHI